MRVAVSRVPRLGRALAAFLCIAPVAASQGTPPPLSLSTAAEAFFIRSAVPGSTKKISTFASLHMIERKIMLEFRFDVGGEVLTESSTHATDYWPTDCNRGPSHTVYVAGKGYTSDTLVLEVWRFRDPRVLQPARLTPLGQTAQRIEPAARTSVTRIHEGPATEGLVRGLVALRGAPSESFLVFFDGSRKLFVVNAATGAMSLVASPTALPGVLHEPLLAEPWRGCYVERRLNEGFLYIFRFEGDDVLETAAPSVLVFRDTNEDGLLDSSQGLNTAEWQALGYGNSLGWLPNDF